MVAESEKQEKIEVSSVLISFISPPARSHHIAQEKSTYKLDYDVLDFLPMALLRLFKLFIRNFWKLSLLTGRDIFGFSLRRVRSKLQITNTNQIKQK